MASKRGPKGGTEPIGGTPGEGRVVEVATAAWPGHEPCLELIERQDGSHAVRFLAYVDGQPHLGPLVLEEGAVAALASALSSAPRLKALLARLVSARVVRGEP